jgi:predicted kinase
VTAADAALARRGSVIIDRCNFNGEQRADFIALAQRCGVPVHCVSIEVAEASLSDKRVFRASIDLSRLFVNGKLIVHYYRSSKMLCGLLSMREGERWNDVVIILYVHPHQAS